MEGALNLDTLVVAPAGNDLPAGPAFGSISGPGGAAGALSVGAADLRSETEQVRVAVRSGLDIQLSRPLPLAGAFAPQGTLQLEVAAPRLSTESSGPVRLDDFFDDSGRSMVAGRAALVPAGGSSELAVENAARAGAYAVLLYGRGLPAGALGLDENVVVPVVVFPQKAAERMLTALNGGQRVSVSLGHAARRPEYGRTPDRRLLLAWALVRRDRQARARGSRRDHPDRRAGDERGRHAALRHRQRDERRGGLDRRRGCAARAGSARARGEGPARPPDGDGAVAEGRARLGSGRRPRRPRPGGRGRALRRAGDTFSAAVRGRRPRPALDLDPQRVHAPAPAARVGSGRAARFCRLPPPPRTLVVRPGAFATVHVAVHAAHRLPEAVEGAITIRPESGQTIRIPWIAAPQPRGSLLGRVTLEPAAFQPSKTFAVLSLARVGRLGLGSQTYVEPVSRLDIALWTSKGKRLGTSGAASRPGAGHVHVRHHRPRADRRDPRSRRLSPRRTGISDHSWAREQESVDAQDPAMSYVYSAEP